MFDRIHKLMFLFAAKYRGFALGRVSRIVGFIISGGKSPLIININPGIIDSRILGVYLGFGIVFVVKHDTDDNDGTIWCRQSIVVHETVHYHQHMRGLEFDVWDHHLTTHIEAEAMAAQLVGVNEDVLIASAVAFIYLLKYSGAYSSPYGTKAVFSIILGFIENEERAEIVRSNRKVILEEVEHLLELER